MQIDERTSYSEYVAIKPYITEESRKRLQEAACRLFGNYYELNFDTFFGLLDGDYSLLGDTKRPTAMQAVWCEGFADFAQELAQKLERLTLKPTARQAKAHEGTYAFDFRSNVLVFIRSYFGLHSFREAGTITVGEYLTARQDAYNTAKIQRNYEQIQREELKTRKR